MYNEFWSMLLLQDNTILRKSIEIVDFFFSSFLSVSLVCNLLCRIIDSEFKIFRKLIWNFMHKFIKCEKRKFNFKVKNWSVLFFTPFRAFSYQLHCFVSGQQWKIYLKKKTNYKTKISEKQETKNESLKFE